MNYQQLKANLEDEGISLEQNNREIADTYNALTKVETAGEKRLTARGVVKVMGMEAGGQLLGAIKAGMVDNPVLDMAYNALHNDFADGGIDVTDSDVQVMLADFVTNGVITQAESDTLTASANQTVPKYPRVTWQQVEILKARVAKGNL